MVGSTKQPTCYDLLLPSIHCSRTDNVLRHDSDSEEAVAVLQAACCDAASWPSSSFTSKGVGEEPIINEQRAAEVELVPEPEQRSYRAVKPEPDEEKVDQIQKLPVFAKYKPPSWAYDAVEPRVIDAARTLFFERKRQQAVYEAFPSWSNPSGAPRIPNDYELFAAWASLPRADKMAFISEVYGGFSASQTPRNSVETQRAISVLYSCCPDSCSWPSFLFCRAQAFPGLFLNPSASLQLPYNFE